jgi:glucosamine--fructose-6-phosphate aminotransferase (isomerizing)
MSKREPGKLSAFRQGNAGGIVVGYGDGEMLVASDLPALLPHTRTVAFLAGGESVTVTPTEACYSTLDGKAIAKTPTTVSYDPVAAVKGQYKHYMLKEIHEQPEVALSAMRGRVSFDTHAVELDGFPLSADEVMRLKRVVLVGMGTSMHAAMAGRQWIESLARIQADYDNSSEFRYRDPVIGEDTLVVSVSQSGETADTLAAMGEAAQKGARQITLCNYEGTQATRIADGTIFIRSGLEVSVAGSKTFTCSLLSLYMLALHLGATREVLSHEDMRRLVDELAQLPHLIGTQLEDESPYEHLARKYALHSDFLYLGRGNQYPIAMEGALKLKEISYIHAEGYQAGEMKHGPISLIDENMPLVALIPQGPLYEKMLNSVSEANARGGRVIAIATEGDSLIEDYAEDVLYVPDVSDTLSPLVTVVPVQLLAYHIAARRGVDVDQPRNLAKTVTVE